MKKRIQETETRQFKAIFPNTLNANDTLFGGQAMQWMDEVAFITATRFTRQRMFTINTGKIRFMKTITPGNFAEVVGCVVEATGVKLSVQVEVWVEDMYTDQRELAVDGTFVFACLDSKNRPCRINYPEGVVF